MTTPELLRYVLDHAQSFGYQKWPIYCDGVTVGYDKPKVQLAASEKRLVEERAYVAALDNVEAALNGSGALRVESLELLYGGYLDNPYKALNGIWPTFSMNNGFGTQYPTATQLDALLKERTEQVRKWEEVEPALKDLIIALKTPSS